MEETKQQAKEYQDLKFIDKVISARAAFAMTILGVGFWIVTNLFTYFATPNEKNSDAITLLQTQVEAQQRANDILTKTLQNDTQEVKGNVKDLTEAVNQLRISIATLNTKIDERIPTK